MIRTEEKQFEEEVLESGHIAVPFELSRLQDGTLDFCVYSFCVKTAEEFEKRFAAEPMSGEATEFLYEKIAPVMNELGFDCTGALDHIYLEFLGLTPDETRIRPDCEILSTLDGEKWADELELDAFELDPDDPCDRMAVIRRKGKIVCYCGLNDISEDDGCLELTVECAADFRRQGFGSSCVAKMTRYLLDRGERVKYVTDLSNQESTRTAAAAGLALNREVRAFVCYRDAETDDADGEELEF